MAARQDQRHFSGGQPVGGGPAKAVAEQHRVEAVDRIDPLLKFAAQFTGPGVFAEFQKLDFKRMRRTGGRIFDFTLEHVAGDDLVLHGSSNPSM